MLSSCLRAAKVSSKVTFCDYDEAICRQIFFSVFRRISEKYRLIDLCCKFGVDCLLPAQDIATFICIIL